MDADLAFLLLEIVLFNLLSRFTFGLTEKPIFWNFRGIRYPTVGKESNTPEMPLKVELLNPTRVPCN